MHIPTTHTNLHDLKPETERGSSNSGSSASHVRTLRRGGNDNRSTTIHVVYMVLYVFGLLHQSRLHAHLALNCLNGGSHSSGSIVYSPPR